MTIRNFIVSSYSPLWSETNKDLFIVDPYVHHVLEKGGRLKEFNSIEVAPYTRQTRADLCRDSDYVDSKCEMYLGILAQRLNKIHGKSYGEFFWRKALSMAFIRYVTFLYDIFYKCENFFDVQTHAGNILSPASYFIPVDFEDQRYLLQNTDYGQEQMFSIYMTVFYPCHFSEVDQVPRSFDQDVQKAGIVAKNPRKPLWCCFREMLRSGGCGGYCLASDTVGRSLEEVGIVGSYFAKEHLDTLVKESGGKINRLDWRVSLNHGRNRIDWGNRRHLSECPDGSDRFDQFFFASLEYCMPRAFVEYFETLDCSYVSLLDQYSRLKYIVSEGWIADTYMSVLLALARERGVKHIFNEHNCFFHPYVGSFLSRAVQMTDVFVTLGWSDSRIPGLVKGASLFSFAAEDKFEKKYNILYVSAPANFKTPHYCSAWGLESESAAKHVEFVRKFFSKLSLKTLSEIAYRPYPQFSNIPALRYDKEYLLSSFLKRVKSVDDVGEPCNRQMRESNLVVIDYVSTAYIEALVMNIPVVFFWDPNTYYLNDEYPDFFESLVKAGICQTDPEKAACFVEAVKDNPQEWWWHENVQAARSEFIGRNLGNPQDMIRYLLDLTKC